MTNNNKVRKEKTKTRPKKAMKTGNTLSLPVLFYKQQEHLPSLSLPLANYKKCCYKQRLKWGLMFNGQGEPTPTFVLALKIIICGWALKSHLSYFPICLILDS